MAEHKKTAEKRNEILAHFCTVIAQDGFEHASVQKIAAQAGISASLLLFYFKNKEELVLNLVDFLLKQYESAFFEDIQNTILVQERFNKAIDTLFGYRWLEVGNPTAFYACYYLSTRNPQIRARFQAMYNRFKAILKQEIDIWVKNGIVKVKNSEEIAESLIMLNEGLSFYQRVFREENYKARSLSVKNIALQLLGKPQDPQ